MVVVVVGAAGVEVEACSAGVISGPSASCVFLPIENPFTKPDLFHPLAAVVVVAARGGTPGRATYRVYFRPSQPLSRASPKVAIIAN